MNTPSIKQKTRDRQAKIERDTAEFLAKGGKIQHEEIRRAKCVDLTFRHYAMSGLDEVESAA